MKTLMPTQNQTFWKSHQRLTETTARQKSLRRIQWLSRFLDNAFTIPVIGRKIGWDGILGLIPGIGDTTTLLMSLGIVYEVWKLGLPRKKLFYMLALVGLDTLVGTVPVVGDLFDLTFKANAKNAEIVREHFAGED